MSKIASEERQQIFLMDYAWYEKNCQTEMMQKVETQNLTCNFDWMFKE